MLAADAVRQCPAGGLAAGRLMRPLSRRAWSAGAVAGLAVAGTALAQPADPGPAAPFIQRTGRELGALIVANTDAAARRDRLASFLDRVVDVDGLARFCLGRYWQAATLAQQAEYRRLFRIVLANNVATRLGAATTGVAQVQMGRPEWKSDEISVPTLVERSTNRPNRVVWVVVPAGDSYRIVDVAAEGISLSI